MTALLLVTLGLLAAWAIYLASLTARRYARVPERFVDGGCSLPSWCTLFAGTGVVLAAMRLHDHFRLTALYGLQASHLALAVIIAALGAVLVQRRLWLAARLSGIASPAELLGSYYGSISVRLFVLLVLLIYALPFAADCLSASGAVLQLATGGAVGRAGGIGCFAAFLFLFSALGGWRGVVYVVAALSLLVLVLIAVAGVMLAIGLARAPFYATGLVPALRDVLGDRIPGVIQYSSGIGRDVAAGGPFTAIALLTAGLSLLGVVLSPGYVLLGNTAGTGRGFAFSQVWMTAGLAGGALLLVGPAIAATLAAGPGGGVGYGPVLARLAAIEPLGAIGFLLVLFGSLLIAVAFFVASAASILTLDVIGRYVLPGLGGAGPRLAARITLALLYAGVAVLAAYAPRLSAVLATLALPLSAQLLPALLGLCRVRWISRSGVVTGLIFGLLLVLFTEPPGLLAVERLLGPLPWGRWPLTIHAAAWGLAFNLAACLIVSVVTDGGPERAHRDRLHDALAREDRPATGTAEPTARSGAGGSARWSLALLWAYLALGPGAILGNDFFSHPVFTEGEAALGVPSLWVWQVVFWLLGVLLLWWLAYAPRLAIPPAAVRARIDLRPAPQPLLGTQLAPPRWIALLLDRVAERNR